MKRSIAHILTTHTGSLPRPRSLVELIREREEGHATDPGVFAVMVNKAVAEAVRQQVESGIDIIDDGEQGRAGYATYVKDRLSGFDRESPPPLTSPWASEFPEWGEISRGFGIPFQRRPACTGSIAWKDFAAAEQDIAAVKKATWEAPVEEVFMTSASPGNIARFLQNDYYPDDQAYLYALAEAMRREYEAIVAAGLLLQIDCPDLAIEWASRADISLGEYLRIEEMHVGALNHATRNIPPDKMRMHVCWGSDGGPHHYDVPMRDIVEVILHARPGALSFVAANPRHEHEWRVWKDVKLPPGKVIIPGVIDSTTNFVEHPELVAERIVRFAKVVGRENVIAGVDCGFGTFAGRAQVDSKIVWLKLQSLVEGARLASRELWD